MFVAIASNKAGGGVIPEYTRTGTLSGMMISCDCFWELAIFRDGINERYSGPRTFNFPTVP